MLIYRACKLRFPTLLRRVIIPLIDLS